MTDLPLDHRPGANNPPTAAELFQGRLNRLLMRYTQLAVMQPTEAVAAQLRDIVAECIKADKDLATEKAREKQPHLDANATIEAQYRPLVEFAAEIKSSARKLIDTFLLAEERRREAEAAKAREIAARAAEEALAAAEAAAKIDSPAALKAAEDAQYAANMANLAETHAEKKATSSPAVASARGGVRATSLRDNWSVKVTDAIAMVAHFASDRDVIDAATKAAVRFVKATKGSQPIPGCENVNDRRSA